LSEGLFSVGYTRRAQADLIRLYRHLLDQARYAEDLQGAQEVINQLREHVEGRLARTPYLYRHALGDSHLRELVVPGSRGGYVALYDITDGRQVTVIAVRHQLEDDYL
jgi:plasmid stabilization system protein ParE